MPYSDMDLLWGLDRIDQRFYPLDEEYEYIFDGSGVEVYIADTGTSLAILSNGLPPLLTPLIFWQYL